MTQLFSSHVVAMLKAAAAAPTTEWKSKDCALFLVTALAARTKTTAGGATTTNDLVDIGDFYRCAWAKQGLMWVWAFLHRSSRPHKLAVH